MRESTHPVAQVARNLRTPNNMLYRWTSQHWQLIGPRHHTGL